MGGSDAARRTYAGTHALVTGGDGFLGSHLVERLLGLGAEVSVAVRYGSHAALGGASLRNLSAVAPRLRELLHVDLAAPEAAEHVERLAPDFLFHLAADAWVPRSFEHPREVVTNNVSSTLSVLQAATRIPGLRRVVVTSSSEVYGTAQTERIGEDHPLEPTSPYAASKLACDRLGHAYHCTFGTPVAIIRPFNTYGPRHVYDVVPKLIRLALAGEPLTVHGSGRQSRDLTYVDDMVEAFLLMGARPEALGRCVGFGTGTAIPILALAQAIVKATGSSSPIVHDAARPAEVERLCCDPSLAHGLFGWRARIDLEEGLRRNVAWARQAWGS